MRFQAGIQITLLVVAIIIAFSVIKPKIESIRVEQNEVASYRQALENIGLYNQQLQTLINQANSVAAYDRDVLWRYLPEEIDATLVSSDISNMASQNRMLLLDIIPNPVAPVTTQSSENFDPNVVSSNNQSGVVLEEGQSTAGILLAQQFQVEVVGTYEQVKGFLRDLERNAYPLTLVEFSFEQDEISTLIQYSLLLETYALPTS